MKDCENLHARGFVHKCRDTKARDCQEFIRQYGRGARQGECKRKMYKKEHGAVAPGDMPPSGQMMADQEK